jgi:hypothetical protein
MKESKNYILLKDALNKRLSKCTFNNKLLHVSIGGSIGRYETELTYNSKNKFSCPNDFDILIIQESQLTQIEQKKIEEILRLEIANEWIDLDFLSLDDRRLKKNSIWLHDFYYHHLHIYGENLKNLIPERIVISSIPKWESFVMFKTRIFTLWSPEFFNSSYKSHYQLSKLLFAIIDINSIADNAYHITYRNKANYAIQRNLLEKTLIQEAYSVKVEGCSFNSKNLVSLRNFLLKEYIEAVSKTFFISRLNLKFLILHPSYFARKIRYLLKGDPKNSTQDFIIFWSELKLIRKILKGENIANSEIVDQAQRRLIWMEKGQ